MNHTSFLLLPVLSVSVEDQARAALFPFELNLLLEQPLLASLLAGHVVVQGLVPLPLFTTVVVLQKTSTASTSVNRSSSRRILEGTTNVCQSCLS